MAHIQKLEHIGIAVDNLDEANTLFASLLGSEHYKVEEVESEGVKTSFFDVGNTKVELLEATNEQSAIAKFIEKRGSGIHHLAYEVDDIHAAMDDLREKGFRLINETPKRGADNKLVCFVHPKSAGGVLMELCQEIRDED